MERLAYAITDHLLRRDVIQKEDYDIYVYGYAVFLEQMCQVIGFILLGIVTKDLLQTALFLGTFYLIRSAFGGYHAETSLVCMLVSYGGWGAVMILSRYMEAYAEVPLVLWIVLAADLCVFAILGPVAHANKPLTAVQKKRNKRNGFLVLGIGSLLQQIPMALEMESKMPRTVSAKVSRTQQKALVKASRMLPKVSEMVSRMLWTAWKMP